MERNTDSTGPSVNEETGLAPCPFCGQNPSWENMGPCCMTKGCPLEQIEFTKKAWNTRSPKDKTIPADKK